MKPIKNEQKPNKPLANVSVGQIYMIYLHHQQRYWPAKVINISNLGLVNNISQVINLQLYNYVDIISKKSKTINVNLNKISLTSIIPFQSAHSNSDQPWKRIEAKSISSSKQFKKAMELATKDYEARLKSFKMYNELKNQSKKLEQKINPIKLNLNNEQKKNFQTQSLVSQSYSLRNRKNINSDVESLKSNSSRKTQILSNQKKLTNKKSEIIKNEPIKRSKKSVKIKNDQQSNFYEEYLTYEYQSFFESKPSISQNRSETSKSFKCQSVKSFQTSNQHHDKMRKESGRQKIKDDKKSSLQNNSVFNKKRNFSKVYRIIQDSFTGQSASKLGVPNKKIKNSFNTINSEAISNSKRSTRQKNISKQALRISVESSSTMKNQKIQPIRNKMTNKTQKLLNKVETKSCKKQAKVFKKIMKLSIYPQDQMNPIEQKSSVSRWTRTNFSKSSTLQLNNFHRETVNINSLKGPNLILNKKKAQFQVTKTNNKSPLKNQSSKYTNLLKNKVQVPVKGKKDQKQKFVKEKSNKGNNKALNLNQNYVDLRLIEQLFRQIKRKANLIRNKNPVLHNVSSGETKRKQNLKDLNLNKPLRLPQSLEDNLIQEQENKNMSGGFEEFLERVLIGQPFQGALSHKNPLIVTESNQGSSHDRSKSNITTMGSQSIIKKEQINQKQSYLKEEFVSHESIISSLQDDIIKALCQYRQLFKSMQQEGLCIQQEGLC